MVLLGLLTASLVGCGNSTRSPVSSTPAADPDTPAGLRAAAVSWADAFLTGTSASIYKMEGADCRTNMYANSAAATAYLRGLRAEIERYLGEPPAAVKVTGVQIHNFTVSRGEAAVQYDLPAAKVGNDNWVAYDYADGRWKVSNCHAPIGGQSSSSSGSSSASASTP